MSLNTGVNHPIKQPKVRFQGNSSPAVPAGLGVGGPPGMGLLARSIASVKPWESVESFFLNTSKDGPMAIVPLESSVLVGRSERAYRRDGWLELQERLSEEMAAAVVWLFGVGFLQNQFEKVANRGKNQHLSTNIAWNKPWVKTTHVDLTPQEMFAKNSKEINTLLGLKSARWVFSVGTALAAVGYFIPKGNQLKTNMILRHLERRKRGSEGSNVQFGDPNNQNQPNGPQQAGTQTTPQPRTTTPSRSLMPHLPVTVGSMLQRPSFIAPSAHSTIATQSTQGPSTTNRSSSQASNQSKQAIQPESTQFLGQGNSNVALSPHGKPGVRFSGGLPGLSAIQSIGAAVEQTDYGQLLAVDFGIAGGRGYVASKRSPYETAEVLFRDIVSLYFYILCAPHLMAGLTAGLDKAFNSSSHLQPKVVELIHARIEEKLKPYADKKQPLPANFLDRVLYGAGDELMTPEGPLREAMRTVDKKAVTDLLNKEIKVYLGEKPLPIEAQHAIKTYLSAEPLNPGHINHLLNAIQDGSNGFSRLQHADRQNLSIALKQATRHSTGIHLSLTPDGIRKHPSFKALFDLLGPNNPKEAEALQVRIERMASREAMDQTHSMLRRSANILRAELNKTGSSKLIERGDALANWLDKSMHHAKTVEQFMEAELKDLGDQLHAIKLDGEKLQQVSRALGGKSLSSPAAFQNALKEAKTSQLKALGNTFEKLVQSTPASTTQKLSLFKNQPKRIKAMSESLANLNLKLAGGASETPSQALKESVVNFVKDLADKATGHEKALLSHYHEAVRKIVHENQGRFFSLATKHEDEVLSTTIREVLRGGLVSDSRLVSQALDTVGQLETDTRKMPNNANTEKMRKAIANYTDSLYKRFNQANAPQLESEALKSFQYLNRNLHYGARGLSLGTAMACIGWLVPIAQTKITKHLTGKDKNPGIASAKKSMDDANAASQTPPSFKAAPANAPKSPVFNAKLANGQSAPFAKAMPVMPQPHNLMPQQYPS